MIDRTRCATITLVLLGTGFVVGGILLFVFGDSLIDSAVKKVKKKKFFLINSTFFIEQGCQLKDGTLAYKAWRNPPVPLHIAFYVFDLNDTEFLNGTKPPFVRQRGPFVYE